MLKVVFSARLLVLGSGFKAIRDTDGSSSQARHWEIADYRQNYEGHILTPTDVAKAIIKALEDAEKASPPMLFLSAFDKTDFLKQARQSSLRQVTDLYSVPEVDAQRRLIT